MWKVSLFQRKAVRGAGRAAALPRTGMAQRAGRAALGEVAMSRRSRFPPPSSVKSHVQEDGSLIFQVGWNGNLLEFLVEAYRVNAMFEMLVERYSPGRR